MSMSTAIAINAQTQAAIAAENAADAKEKACNSLVRSYQHEGSTVAEMRQYADCIDTIHPADMAYADIVVFKVTVGLIFIGMFIGSYVGLRTNDPIPGVFVGGVLGACVTFLTLLGLALFYLGVMFLFS